MNKRNRKLNTADNIPTNINPETDVEKVILAQIQYCRFLNLVFDEIRNSGMDHLREMGNQVAKKVIQNI
jgi:hypothetical protein